MKKIWYVNIHNTQEGPYSVEDLKAHDRITPDTLVWKEGFPRWIRIRDVPELRKIFKDPPKPKDGPEEKKTVHTSYDQMVLAYQQDPNSIFWMIVIILALIYSLYQFYVFT